MRCQKALAVAVLCVCAGGRAVGQGEQGVPLDGRHVRLVSGGVRYQTRPISIGGKVHSEWLAPGDIGVRATFNIRGYARFTGYAGNKASYRSQGDAWVEVDGETVWKGHIISDEKAKPIDLDLAGHETLTLRSKGCTVTFFDPMVFKTGVPAAQPARQATMPGAGQATGGPKTDVFPGAAAAPAAAAAFAVDPKDLDSLAEALRKAIDDKPALKERLAAGKIAIATFSLVDIASPSVAQNVAEDLATAMIEKEFRLVERGQLDAVLKELRIQNTGLIDPKSAQEIGRLTGCTLILVGSISDRGGFIAVNARLLETESGESVAAKCVEMRKIPISRQ